jgi:hypothetical protein
MDGMVKDSNKFLTYPDCAALVDPLSASRKEGEDLFAFSALFKAIKRVKDLF